VFKRSNVALAVKRVAVKGFVTTEIQRTDAACVMQEVGCDGHVGSGSVFDNCHVCNGSNVGCQRHFGTLARYCEFGRLV